MAPATTPLLPGSMTVPVWYGWEAILALLVLVIVAAVAFLVITATGSARSQRSEWRAWLDARTSAGDDSDSDSAPAVSAEL
jgi:hypothetical protein